MVNWNKEHIKLRVKGNPVGRHGKVFFDDVEVGRIRAGLPGGTNSTEGVSYDISSAAYGAQPPLDALPILVADPTSIVDIVLIVVITLCLNDRSYDH